MKCKTQCFIKFPNTEKKVENMRQWNVLDAGCSLGIGDWKMLQLLYRILRLHFACSLKEPVTLHYSPATTIFF